MSTFGAQVVIGPKVPIMRNSHVPGKMGAPMKDKAVKFGNTEGPTPAYLRTRAELEDRAKRGGRFPAQRERERERERDRERERQRDVLWCGGGAKERDRK